VIFAWWQF